MRKIGAAAALTLALAGCAGTTTDTKSVEQPQTTTDVAEETPTPTPDAPTTEDFAVKLKIKEQQCFGSAGCNVTVEPKISIVGVVPEEGTADLTFKISGDESGSVIETAELDLAGGTYSTSEIYLSTSSSGVVPKAKITEVEYTN